MYMFRVIASFKLFKYLYLSLIHISELSIIDHLFPYRFRLILKHDSFFLNTAQNLAPVYCEP